MKRLTTGAVLAVLGLAVLTGCGDKYTQPYQDAKRDGANTGPAETGTMPDGFSNYATKCDHGNRVYVLYHADSSYGSIAVVPGDSSCKGTQ